MTRVSWGISSLLRFTNLDELVDHGLGDVGNYGEAAGHVAVKSAVANRHFGFVSGAEDQRAEFIGERHQEIAADAGLDVFFGGVFRASCERSGERLAVTGEGIDDGQVEELDAEIFGKLLGIAETAF